MTGMLPPLPAEQQNAWAGPQDDGSRPRVPVWVGAAVGAGCLVLGAFAAAAHLFTSSRTSWLEVAWLPLWGVMLLASAGASVLAKPGQARRGRGRWRGQSRGWRACTAVELISAGAGLAVLAVWFS